MTEVQRLTGIHDPRWLTEEGIAGSVDTTRKLVADALEDPEQFLELTRYGPGMRHGESPLERSTLEGLRAIGRSEKGMWEALEVWGYLRPYSSETVIAAAVLQEERVGIARLVEPAEAFMIDDALHSVLQRALTETDDSEDAIIRLEMGLSQVPSFREFKTPQGRVEQIVGATSKIMQDPEKVTEAIRRVEEGSGCWGTPVSSPYSQAVAAGLKKLLNL